MVINHVFHVFQRYMNAESFSKFWIRLFSANDMFGTFPINIENDTKRSLDIVIEVNVEVNLLNGIVV